MTQPTGKDSKNSALIQLAQTATPEQWRMIQFEIEDEYGRQWAALDFEHDVNESTRLERELSGIRAVLRFLRAQSRTNDKG